MQVSTKGVQVSTRHGRTHHSDIKCWSVSSVLVHNRSCTITNLLINKTTMVGSNGFDISVVPMMLEESDCNIYTDFENEWRNSSDQSLEADR